MRCTAAAVASQTVAKDLRSAAMKAAVALRNEGTSPGGGAVALAEDSDPGTGADDANPHARASPAAARRAATASRRASVAFTA
jgi:hypothetical protein